MNFFLKFIFYYVNYRKRFGKLNFIGILIVLNVKFIEWIFFGFFILGLKDVYIDK